MHKNITKKNYIIKNENKITITIFGLFLLGISIFLFLSFSSFLFYWKKDQSQLIIFDKEIIAENLLGKIGAIASHYFIHCGIGISAFFIPVLLFFTGIKILLAKKNILDNFYKSIIYKFIFFSIWIPITCHLILPDKNYKGIFSGIFGFEIGNFLINLFGKIGLFILIVISISLYYIIFLRIRKVTIKKKYNS
ncbi:DNA translocase FtsK 4TM domain-containing protein [Blattabacterium cuenoti]|uniref:DNA translocase FtsK 4TM domain-containing protein n=1 Tax=Blattabacterium cuenoti TaxID=1653831 RepID=UPI00163CBF58|nr:DNA translocase FtsK 4TM domain-containing protein [Blattabacterium cuenoti]